MVVMVVYVFVARQSLDKLSAFTAVFPLNDLWQLRCTVLRFSKNVYGGTLLRQQ
jgi:hypothetical protein